MYYGVDVSDWQGPINWNVVKQNTHPPISFAYGKATDGASFLQDTFAHNHDQCGEIGLPFGAYHFFRFEDDPAEQAANFCNATLGAGRGGVLLPMVDVEIGNGSSGILASYLGIVQQSFKVPFVLIYTDSNWWDTSELGNGFSGHPLWIANFIGNDPTGEPAMPETGGWKQWSIWQYDNQGTVAGIGNTDLDCTPSLDALRRPGV
jgi:lysozyme